MKMKSILVQCKFFFKKKVHNRRQVKVNDKCRKQVRKKEKNVKNWKKKIQVTKIDSCKIVGPTKTKIDTRKKNLSS